jgi:hypothetical protein
MRIILLLSFLSINCISLAQKNTSLVLKSKTHYNDSLQIAKSYSNSNFYLIKNSIVKKTLESTYTYNNINLGKLYKIDLFNPLQIKLFYKDQNSIVILDNKLSEIKKINFNYSDPLINVVAFSSANENNIWVYDEISMRLKKYNYIRNLFDSIDIPIQGDVISLKANYNYCWLLTNNHLYKFNYTGSLIYKIQIREMDSFNFYKNNLIFVSNNNLFLFDESDGRIEKINYEKLLIKDFFVIDETLYIYDENFLNQFEIKIN